MKHTYICSICGLDHIGLITDRAYTLPDEVWAIHEVERWEKAQFNSDLCRYNEHNFIRCVLEVPIRQASRNFGWGVWAEVDWPTFERYLELYDLDGTSEPARTARLANALPPYPESLGRPVVIRFRGPSKRPLLYLMSDDDSSLAKDQRAGIDDMRHHEILAKIRVDI